MGRMYVASGDVSSGTSTLDIWQMTAPSAAICILHRITLSQSDSETDEAFAIALSRAASSGTTGGTAISGNPLDPGDAADSTTIHEAYTTPAGTKTVLFNWGVSTLAGFEHIWTPEERPILGGSDIVVLEITTALTSAVTLEWSVVYEEIG